MQDFRARHVACPFILKGTSRARTKKTELKPHLEENSRNGQLKKSFIW